jgi:hypothetical protein
MSLKLKAGWQSKLSWDVSHIHPRRQELARLSLPLANWTQPPCRWALLEGLLKKTVVTLCPAGWACGLAASPTYDQEPP